MCAVCGCAGNAGHEHDHPHDHDHGHDHDHSHPDHHHPHPHSHAHAGATISTSLEPALVRLERDVLAKNEHIAAHNRAWLSKRRVLALNFVSSPGAGKTTLLERTIKDLGREVPIRVIEGDQETANDAERIRGAGAEAIQINTGTGCHLDASMIERALPAISPPDGSLLAIENVGNLVCPALFDLGEDAKVVVASVTDGEDKPLKYPHMFRASALVLLNKIDLLPHLDFDVDHFLACVRRVNARAEVVPLSVRSGEGLDRWYGWIRARMSRLQNLSPHPLPTSHPTHGARS